MFASFTTLVHFAISARRKLTNSSGVPVTGSAPICASLFLACGLRRRPPACGGYRLRRCSSAPPYSHHGAGAFILVRMGCGGPSRSRCGATRAGTAEDAWDRKRARRESAPTGNLDRGVAGNASDNLRMPPMAAHRAYQHTVRPPSRTSVCPVTYAASGLTR